MLDFAQSYTPQIDWAKLEQAHAALTAFDVAADCKLKCVRGREADEWRKMAEEPPVCFAIPVGCGRLWRCLSTAIF